MTPGDLAELYAAHHLLQNAYEHLLSHRDIRDVSAQLILLDVRVGIQEILFDYNFRESQCF